MPNNHGQARCTAKTKAGAHCRSFALKENPERARKIALAILAKAEKGDVRAFDAAADRLEGKPTQAVAIETADSQGDPGARLAELLERARRRMLEAGSGGSGRRGRPA